MPAIEPHEHIENLSDDDRLKQIHELDAKFAAPAYDDSHDVRRPVIVVATDPEVVQHAAQAARHLLETGGDPDLRSDDDEH